MVHRSGRTTTTAATCVILLVLAITTAHAGTFTWSGGGGSPDWDDSSSCGVDCSSYDNWSEAATLPGPGDSILFASAFTSGTPELNGDRTIDRLQIDYNTDQTLIAAGPHALTLQSGNITRTSTSSGNQTISSPIVLGGDHPNWNIAGSGSLTIDAPISTQLGFGHRLAISGPGTVIFTGSEPNAYFKVLILDGDITLVLAKENGVTALDGKHIEIGPGAILRQTSNEQISDTIPSLFVSIGGMWDFTDQSEILRSIGSSGVIKLGDLTVSSGGISGLIEGAGTITKVGTGESFLDTLALEGFSDNTYTGLTWVKEGTLLLNMGSCIFCPPDEKGGLDAFAGNLRIGDGIGDARSAIVLQGTQNNIPDTSDVYLDNDAWWDMAGKPETINALAGTGVVTVGSLTVGADNATSTFDGVLEGPGSLTTTGNGTFSLNGANTYAGTTVAAGTLGGTGSVAGPVVVQDGATLAPGASTGTFTINNTLTLNPTATVAIEVSPTGHDQLIVTGAVALDGTLAVTALPDAATIQTIPLGTEMAVMTFATRSGSMFDAITGSLIDTGFALAPLFTDTDLTLRASIPGDTNLDNAVSVADLSTFALNFGTTPGLGNWELGDFNADGEITVADLSLLALNFGFDLDAGLAATGLSLDAAASIAGIEISAVPEPAALVVLSLFMLPLLRDRQG